MNNQKYQRKYDLNFCYKLPFKLFSESYEIKKYVDEISSHRNISVEDTIDIYVNIAIDGLSDTVTKMIKHDGVCNRKNLNCIIDYAENNEIRNKIIKKKF